VAVGVGVDGTSSVVAETTAEGTDESEFSIAKTR
jgi:hypothetical protein